ncbi:hypothetical protein [Streptantibioticus silvisoli]|uniref:ARB-07466-like C-terminal domain-containing protein n=1 Tax=Streptantibioticus silvisoli TaxID=2705255 RepID=A0ABT6VZI9_9ACTN|nr:hypothetical protein [Streptantibioticus silvisoli]MDI5963901.1 hypothetical protein [Streptantibioticus silvisoli]
MPRHPSASKPRRKRVRWGAATLALLAVAGYVTLREVAGAGRSDCSVAAGGSRLGLAQDQAANAATIGAVAVSRDLPERALTIALATAMQESDLRNLSGGDRDSLGLFQQRPSQGWGTREQIVDPVYSANEFFDELVKIPGYSRLPLTVAAQRVQRSGYPQAYAKHEADASLLAGALSGRAPSLTCRVVSGTTPGDPARVTARLTREFGARIMRPYAAAGLPDSGTAAGGTSAPAPGGGAADPTVTVPGDSAGEPTGLNAAQHGWVLAQWAVAHAAELRITEVRYRGRVWWASRSDDGWTSDSRPAGQAYGDVRITVQH